MGHNRRRSTAPFARPIFADGALGALSACFGAGSGLSGEGASQGGVAQQAIGLPIDVIPDEAFADRGSSGGGSGDSVSSGGTTYSRSWWIVPTTRRVRGTTISGTITGGEAGAGGDDPGAPPTASRSSASPGGLIVHSGTDRDVIFVEPARAGEPTGPVEIQLTTPDGRPIGGPEKLLRSCYYIIADDAAKGVRLSRAYPWTSSASSPHDPAARAVFNALRKAAIASGRPAMSSLPDLVGP